MLVVYLSLTGNIRRFVNKIDGISTLEIDQTNPFIEIDKKYVLIIPSYSDTLTDIICDFIDYKGNSNYLQGVIGSGEKNFNKHYIFSAKDIAKKYDIPLVLDFEKSGTHTDVEKFKKEVFKY